MAQRQQWTSNLGFILAAAGSAIGLGNIVFFSANAYRFGAGAFYLPYLLALIVCGIPVMMLEFGLGKRFEASFPIAMGRVGGRAGEIVGWFAGFNALIITMYYTTILAWTAGMWWYSATGSLFAESVAVPNLGLTLGEMENPSASFFKMISSYSVMFSVALVWLMNYIGVVRGTKTIETMVRWMVPFIWVVMILFVIQGFSLNGGIHGAFLLFTPQFEIMGSPQVWNGAFSQIFFTLSLGFGIMTAYASYLPRDTDHTTSAIVVSSMNCSFEAIAGLAIFSLLFAFSLLPQASTLGMMFFVVPKAIGSLPIGVQWIGAAFFTLLMAAGLTSSTSLLESVVSALSDKLLIQRKHIVLLVSALGAVGSLLFALPKVIDPALESSGTLGLSLLDLADHYAFSYGLIMVGLFECIMVGWWMPVRTLRQELNESSRIQLGVWFDVLIRWVLPLILGTILVWTMLTDLGVLGATSFPNVYGKENALGSMDWLPIAVPIVWLSMTMGLGVLLSQLPTRHQGRIVESPVRGEQNP